MYLYILKGKETITKHYSAFLQSLCVSDTGLQI